MELNDDNGETRAGAFFGLVAGVLVLALTAMAFSALDPPRVMQAFNWEVADPEPAQTVVPSFRVQ
ncbi:MAG: hypothetical protein AB7H66_17605 [Hyphomonadaceae bacterium]